MSNYLAVFTGAKDSPRMKAWMAMPEAERKAKEQEGIAAWGAWMQKHASVVVDAGGRSPCPGAGEHTDRR